MVPAGQALRTPYDAGQSALGRRWPMHQAESSDDHWAGQRHALVTAEELTILALMAEGLTLDSVAVRMTMSPRTLSRRLRCVCDRLGVAHPIQAIVWAAHQGFI